MDQLKHKNFYQESEYIRYLRNVVQTYELITGKDRDPKSYDQLNKIADPHLIACGLYLRQTAGEHNIFIVSEEKRSPDANGVKKLHKVKIPNVCAHETIDLSHLSLSEFLWQTIFRPALKPY